MPVSVIHHHRLAFYYWVERTTQRWTCSLPRTTLAPDLVTIDWHNDVGGECDCILDELKLLLERLEDDSPGSEQERSAVVDRRDRSRNNVAAYTFLGLRALNDGQIFPAQYLNAIGDVYVLYKQGRNSTRTMTDQYGLPHKTVYSRTPASLIKQLKNAPPRPTYLDIDVDYFFNPSRGRERGSETMVPEGEIRHLLDPQNELMSHIIPRPLRGMTIALEPTYCAGLTGCFRAMSIISDTLFSGSLLSPSVDWRPASTPRRR